MRYSSRWAVGSWFVPILNLVRPKQIAGDLFAATASPNDRRPVPMILHVWWTLLLVSAGVARAASASGVRDARRMATGDRWAAVGDVAMIAAGVLAILLVRELTARQIARRADELVDRTPADLADPRTVVGPPHVHAAPLLRI